MNSNELGETPSKIMRIYEGLSDGSFYPDHLGAIVYHMVHEYPPSGSESDQWEEIVLFHAPPCFFFLNCPKTGDDSSV